MSRCDFSTAHRVVQVAFRNSVLAKQGSQGRLWNGLSQIENGCSEVEGSGNIESPKPYPRERGSHALGRWGLRRWRCLDFDHGAHDDVKYYLRQFFEFGSCVGSQKDNAAPVFMIKKVTKRIRTSRRALGFGTIDIG